MNILNICSVKEKIAQLPAALEAYRTGTTFLIPEVPGRDALVVPITTLRDKVSINTAEGQARLLHDLGNVELQAMELCFRTLAEYPHLPKEFKDEISVLCTSEAKHLGLCIQGIEQLGFFWGKWPVHLSLWNAVKREDHILDRIAIVHRYLEGSGLDAAIKILHKLSSAKAVIAKKVVDIIYQEELGHVDFGSRWYRHFCVEAGVNPETDFCDRMQRFFNDDSRSIPRRKERVHRASRMATGFNMKEIEYLESLYAGPAGQ